MALAVSLVARRRRAGRAGGARGASLLLVGFLTVVVAGRAEAQPAGGVGLARMHPAPAGSEWLVLDSLGFRGHLVPTARLLLDSAHEPFVPTNADGTRRAAVVSQQLIARASVAVTLRDRYRVALDVPASPLQSCVFRRIVIARIG